MDPAGASRPIVASWDNKMLAIREHFDHDGSIDPIEALSRRQLEVLELLAKGLTNDELAGILKISPTTVRTHITAILARLDLTNRTEAATAYVAWKAGARPSTSRLRRPAIAVLPPVAFAEDPRTRAVATAIGHDISALFSRRCWFPVIAQSATAHGPAATFLLESTLRGSSRWRLSVCINAAATGHCLWTACHDIAEDPLFAGQDAVCEAVVAAAYPVLIAHTEAGLRRVSDRRELQTWELALEGMRLYGTRVADANTAARSCFRAALEREPDLVLAHYGLGLTCHADLLHQWRPREDALGDLRVSAERCVALAPHSAEGHYLFGCYFLTLGDAGPATRSLEAAIRHDPSFTAATLLLSQTLKSPGAPRL